jgi:hypothetical protein|tara:strand:+ start:3433 stop:5862 length:2430 start_codon:yes stop_codon:yes gene_type:complete
MAASNFGSGGFGSGLVSGLTQGLGYGQQQRASQLARDRFDLDQDKFDYSKTRDAVADTNWEKEYKIALDSYNIAAGADTRAKETWTRTEDEAAEKQLYKDNDRIIAAGMSYGFIDKTDPSKLDRENTIALIREGGKVADSWVMDRFNASKGTGMPEGFTVTRFDRDPTTGEIAAYGTHAKQKNPQHLTDKLNPGVITTDGSSEDDSPIALFTPEKLAAILDDEYRLTIPLNSGLGSTSALAQFGAMTAMSDADAEVARQQLLKERQTQAALTTLHTRVITANDTAARDPATGEGTNVEMMRDFRSNLASAESEEERLEILIDGADLFGVEVPDILMNQGASNELPAPSTERQLGTSSGAMGQAPIEGDDLLMTDNPPNRYQQLQHGLPTRYRPAVLEKKIAEQKAVLEKNDLDTEKGRTAQDTLDALMQQKYGEDSFVGNAVSPEAKTAAEQLHNGILAQFDRMSNEETADAITNGDAVATPEDQANLAIVLKDAGVKVAGDIKNMPLETQRNARALLAIIAPEAAQRNQFAKELVSIGTGGTALSSARELDVQKTSEGTLAVNQRNADTAERRVTVDEARVPIDQQRANTATDTLNLNRLERTDSLAQYVDAQADKIGKEVTEQLTNVVNSMYALDDKGNPIPGQIADFNYGRVSSALSESLSVISRKLGTTRKDSNAEAQLVNAQNAIFSMGIQALAESEEYGSFGEMWPDGEIDFFDQNDNALSRVDIFSEVESGDNKGQPLRWMIRSLGSKTQIEETIPSSVIKNMFGDEGYKAFVDNFREIEIKRKRDEKRAAAKRKRDANNSK